VRSGPAGTEAQSICASAIPGKLARNIARTTARIALRGVMMVSKNIGDGSIQKCPTRSSYACSCALLLQFEPQRLLNVFAEGVAISPITVENV